NRRWCLAWLRFLVARSRGELHQLLRPLSRINPDASGFKSANRRGLPKLCTRNLNAGQVLYPLRDPMSANAFGCDKFGANGGSQHHLAPPAVSLAIAVAANTNVVPVNSLARKVER